MKAVVCPQLGDPSVLVTKECQSLECGPQQVKVALYAVGINFSDLLMISGRYQELIKPPFVPGTEGSGVVVEIGNEVDEFIPGDKVIVQNNTGRGCYAEEVVAHRTRLAKLPAKMDFVSAAGFAIPYGTAYHALIDRGRIISGETVLVHGAAGGVGLATVQLAKAMGATVIATAGSDAKREAVTANGADHVLNSRDGCFTDQVSKLTDGNGADVVIDPVGGDVFDESIRSLSPEGRLIVIGFASGRIPSITANRILLKEIAVIGAAYGPFTARAHARWGCNMATLFEMFERGYLGPVIHKCFALNNAAEALAGLLDRTVIGKSILVTKRATMSREAIGANYRTFQ